MKAHRIFRRHKVQTPLRFALEVLRGFQRLGGIARLLRLFNVFYQPHHRFFRPNHQRLGAILYRLCPGFELSFRKVMARLAGIGNVEQRAAHVMIADFDRAFAFVGHVTIGAGDATARMNALAPRLKLRVLRFENGRAACFVSPVLKSHLIIIAFDLFNFNAFVPRIGQELAFTFEIKSTERVTEDEVRSPQQIGKDISNSEAFCLSIDPVPKKIGEVSCFSWQRGLEEIGL